MSDKFYVIELGVLWHRTLTPPLPPPPTGSATATQERGLIRPIEQGHRGSK